MQQSNKKTWFYGVLSILKNLVLAVITLYFFVFLFMLWGFNYWRGMPLWQILILTTVLILLAFAICPPLRGLYKKHFAICLVGLIVCYASVAMWDIKKNQEWKELLFKKFIAEPIPADVKIIDANFFSWMDYSGAVTFRTNETTLNKILVGYQHLPSDKSVGNIFSAKIMQNMGMQRYFKNIPKEDRMHEGRYIFWDHKKQIAYFHVRNEFEK